MLVQRHTVLFEHLPAQVSLFANLTGTLRFCWGPEPLGTCLSSLAVPGGH